MLVIVPGTGKKRDCERKNRNVLGARSRLSPPTAMDVEDSLTELQDRSGFKGVEVAV